MRASRDQSGIPQRVDRGAGVLVGRVHIRDKMANPDHTAAHTAAARRESVLG